ncbi:hypothetical protein FALBO_4942 [Fusarium albosuccineum]|uniref:Ubiquitin-like protease family profile domain-containing protein n=1 Tax=Fusarium albosuccineum TaxID=1237068 RepID=A0A8H4LFP0_9HYPO|nr:hypothetical protein FALBO_4942 [Fusarium albosuccineum]
MYPLTPAWAVMLAPLQQTTQQTEGGVAGRNVRHVVAPAPPQFLLPQHFIWPLRSRDATAFSSSTGAARRRIRTLITITKTPRTHQTILGGRCFKGARCQQTSSCGLNYRKHSVAPIHFRAQGFPLAQARVPLLCAGSRNKILGTNLINDIIATCETPRNVDVERILFSHEQDQREEARKGFVQGFDKLTQANKQLGKAATDDEKKRKRRADDCALRDKRVADLDRDWPGWLPADIRASYRGSDIPVKVVRNITHVVTAIKEKGEFHLDSLWAPTGIFRQKLQSSPNSGYLSENVTLVAKDEIIRLLKQGGIPALVAAQAADDVSLPPLESDTNIQTSAESAELNELFAPVANTFEPFPEFGFEQDIHPRLYGSAPVVSGAPAPDLTHTTDDDTELPVDSGSCPPLVYSRLHLTDDDPNTEFEPRSPSQDSFKPLPSPSPRPPKPSPPKPNPSLFFTKPPVAPFASTGSMMEASASEHHSRVSLDTAFMTREFCASMVFPTGRAKRHRSGSDLGEGGRSHSRQKIDGKYGLCSSKILNQLTNDNRLTDDVLNVVCKVIYARYVNDSNKGILLNTLWFRGDKPSDALPQKLRAMGGYPTKLYFPINDPEIEHWALGTLEPLSDGFQFCYYDPISSSTRYEAARTRLRKWLDESGFDKEHLESKQKASVHLVQQRNLHANYMTQPCAKQHDNWSCGVYVVSFLSMVLQRKATTNQIDPASEKNEIISILKTAQLDGAFSDEEKEALEGLQKYGEGCQQVSFEDRLAKCSLETLNQRLQVSRQRLTEATTELARASEEVSKLSGRLGARDGMIQELSKELKSVKGTLDQHASHTREMASRRASGVHQLPPSSPAQSPSSSGLFSRLDQTHERSQSQSDRIHHDGVRLGAESMLDHMQNLWLNLDKELTAANDRKVSAETAAEDALKEMQGCHKAVMAKTDHDAFVRAQSESEKCRVKHEMWKAADMDGEISLPAVQDDAG